MIPRLSIDRPLGRHGGARVLGGTLLLMAAVLGGAALLGAAADGAYASLALSLGIAMVLTIGYQIFAGSTGVVSFGHPGFVALGAYTAGLLAVPPPIKAATLPHLPPFLAAAEAGPVVAILCGGAVAAAAALLIGPIVMRLAGAASGIMTFGFLVIMNELLRNAQSLTRGNQTFFGVPKLADFGLVWGAVLAAALLSIGFKFSAAGLRARAVREDPLAAETAGINLVAARLWPWVLSAFVMGAGGALMAFFLTAFSPKSFYTALVIPMMIMAVLGGLYSVAGAVAGTILLTAWEQVMRVLESGGFGFAAPLGISQLTLGVGLVLVLYWRPGGLLGSQELVLGRGRGRTGSG
ncbi:MAG: branched-chain amino acid ABC transporter permease [Dongiaceae bacterium]